MTLNSDVWKTYCHADKISHKISLSLARSNGASKGHGGSFRVWMLGCVKGAVRTRTLREVQYVHPLCLPSSLDQTDSTSVACSSVQHESSVTQSQLVECSSTYLYLCGVIKAQLERQNNHGSALDTGVDTLVHASSMQAAQLSRNIMFLVSQELVRSTWV